MAAGFCRASITSQGSAPCEAGVKRTHFHRVSNGFNLKSVVAVVTDMNFTPRTTTIICITILYFPYSTLATLWK